MVGNWYNIQPNVIYTGTLQPFPPYTNEAGGRVAGREFTWVCIRPF